jgi:Ca2+-binding RTX toxin-like protein
MPRISGSNRNDSFSLSASQLNNYQLRGGRGYDTLKVTGSGNTSVSQTVTSQWREMEAIDLSAFSGSIDLAINPLMLSTSNTGALDLTLGANSSLTLSSTVAGVKLWGTGQATLSSSTANIVEIASATIGVTGGALNDRITASTFGSTLDGGGGNDTLVGNSGADVFVHRAGQGSDIFQNFNAAQDKVALDGFSGLSWWDVANAITQSGADTIITLPDGTSLTLTGVNATQLTQDDFTVDGQPLPEFGATVVIEPGTSAAVINDIIARVPDGTEIVFADGEHVLDAPLVVQRDNITLRGESESGTILKFDFPAGQGGNFIEVGSVQKEYLTVTSTDAAAGANTLTLANASGLQAGDVIYIYQPNTAEYLAANGWTNVSMTDAESRPFREFIVTVSAVDGNTVTLDSPLPYGFSATDTRVFAMDMTSGVSLLDFTVMSSLGTANGDAFTNAQSAFDGASAIYAAGSQGLLIDGLTLLDNPSNGLTLQSSIAAQIVDLTIRGAHNKGGEGNGYGILLSEAFNNDLSGLTIFDMRHSIIFSAWNAESGNAIHVLDTNRDINFHGSPDNGNTITVDRLRLEYDTSVDPSQWAAVSGGGASHAATDIWGGNTIKFAFAVGAGNTDKLVGADGGSYLNGMGSNDILIGGNGDDVLVGNLRRDTLTGGVGRDTFVFRMGDDLDTITDMQFGAGGDTIVIMGNPAVDGFEDLVFTQDGADLRVRYGSNSTIILKDTLLSEVDASNFIFDPISLNWLDEWNGLP